MWETLSCPVCGMPVEVDVNDESGQRTIAARQDCENERNRMHRPVPIDDWIKTL